MHKIKLKIFKKNCEKRKNMNKYNEYIFPINNLTITRTFRISYFIMNINFR